MSHSLPRKSALLWLAVSTVCSGAALADNAAIPKARLMHAPDKLVERAPAADQTAQQPRPNALFSTVLKAAPGVQSPFEKSYDLFIRYTDGTIFNPSTNSYDKVHLRAFQQKTDKSWNAEDGYGFQPPTVVAVPGQTVRFRLYNQLPEETDCDNGWLNAPGKLGCFNTTNLHAHGLWVSPAGNSDNVLISIKPGVNFEYEYNIPADHPAGTFWYHPHQHGATAMQVASGMAGAIIVEGDRYPAKDEKNRDITGDLDTLLKKFQPVGGSADEVLLLAQIPYGCATKIVPTPKERPLNTYWDCAGRVGTLEDFEQVEAPSAWKVSRRFTTLNGKVQPIVDLLAQRVYRWRVIDTGFQATVTLRIKRIKDASKLGNHFEKPVLSADVANLCDGEDVSQFEAASDGLTHTKIISKTTNYLQPGYRSDILFSLPKEGAYCIYDDKSSNNLNGDAKNTTLMGIIVASANPRPPVHGAATQSQADFLRDELILAAREMPVAPAIKQEIEDDLKNDLGLSKFVPHPGFTKEDIARMQQQTKQYVNFSIADVPVPRDPILPKSVDTLFMVKGDSAVKQPDSVEYTYHADRVDHLAILGTEQIWELTSELGAHPFHIHVNPFQILSIKVVDERKRKPELDAQYKDLVGTWKDTLLVASGYKIQVATRYERYIGEFVLHCHILEHEDQGMMQNVKIVLPDGKGGAASGGHEHH